MIIVQVDVTGSMVPVQVRDSSLQVTCVVVVMEVDVVVEVSIVEVVVTVVEVVVVARVVDVVATVSELPAQPSKETPANKIIIATKQARKYFIYFNIALTSGIWVWPSAIRIFLTGDPGLRSKFIRLTDFQLVLS